MGYNNLKYSIWSVLANVLYLICMVTCFVVAFEETDITLSIVLLLLIILGFVALYFSIFDIQFFQIDDNNVIVRNLFGIIQNKDIGSIKKIVIMDASIFSIKMLHICKEHIVLSFNKSLIKANVEDGYNNRLHKYIILPYNEEMLTIILSKYNSLTGDVLEVK